MDEFSTKRTGAVNPRPDDDLIFPLSRLVYFPRLPSTGALLCVFTKLRPYTKSRSTAQRTGRMTAVPGKETSFFGTTLKKLTTYLIQYVVSHGTYTPHGQLPRWGATTTDPRFSVFLLLWYDTSLVLPLRLPPCSFNTSLTHRLQYF
jgi:hypothetical protein